MSGGVVSVAELIKMGRLVEIPIEGTAYTLLGLADPKQTPTMSERVAIAKRIIELSGKLPQYAQYKPKPKPTDDLSALTEGMTVDSQSIVSIAADMGRTVSFDKAKDTWTIIDPQHGNIDLKVADIAKMTSNDLRSKLNPPGKVLTMSGRQFTEGAKDGNTPVAKARPSEDVQPAAPTTKGSEMKRQAPSTKKSSKATKATAKKTAAAAPAPKKRSDADPSAKVSGVSAAVAKGAANGFDENAKIAWLIKENPRREGSDTHRRFAKYFGAATVKDYFAKGGTAGDLRWDANHKYLTVSKTK